MKRAACKGAEALPGTVSPAASTPVRTPWEALVRGLRARLDKEPERPELLARLACEAVGLTPAEIASLEAIAERNQTSLGGITWDAWRRARGSGFATSFAFLETPETTPAKRRRAQQKDLPNDQT